MSQPVDTAPFWKERLERANREGREHYSVYLTHKEAWDRIAATHRKILERETQGLTKILDAGCGYGRASEWFADRKSSYIGVDSSPDFVEKARLDHPGFRFDQNDLRDLPYKDRQFDVAFCISIRQMILGNLGSEYWEAIERELKRVAERVVLLEYEEPDFYHTV